MLPLHITSSNQKLFPFHKQIFSQRNPYQGDNLLSLIPIICNPAYLNRPVFFELGTQFQSPSQLHRHVTLIVHIMNISFFT